MIGCARCGEVVRSYRALEFHRRSPCGLDVPQGLTVLPCVGCGARVPTGTACQACRYAREAKRPRPRRSPTTFELASEALRILGATEVRA